jgi:hypothetical protein
MWCLGACVYLFRSMFPYNQADSRKCTFQPDSHTIHHWHMDCSSIGRHLRKTEEKSLFKNARNHQSLLYQNYSDVRTLDDSSLKELFKALATHFANVVLLTYFAILPHETRRTVASICIGQIRTRSAIDTRQTSTFVDICRSIKLSI